MEKIERQQEDELDIDGDDRLEAIERSDAERTPEPPAWFDALPSFDEEPIGTDWPEHQGDAGWLKEIHEENNQEHPEAPAAALARFRSRGHPARAQELASTIANGWRFPE